MSPTLQWLPPCNASLPPQRVTRERERIVLSLSPPHTSFPLLTMPKRLQRQAEPSSHGQGRGQRTAGGTAAAAAVPAASRAANGDTQRREQGEGRAAAGEAPRPRPTAAPDPPRAGLDAPRHPDAQRSQSSAVRSGQPLQPPSPLAPPSPALLRHVNQDGSGRRVLVDSQSSQVRGAGGVGGGIQSVRGALRGRRDVYTTGY